MNSDPDEAPTMLRNHWWWRPGWRPDHEFYTWHITFDGQDDLYQLVTSYQQHWLMSPGSTSSPCAGCT